MKMHHLSNQALHDQLTHLATEERRITLDVLHHLRECERRRLYAERGHSSLFDYVVNELGYAESSAQRRISAMRALRDLPDLEVKVARGELKVTQLARVQTFLRAEKKEGKVYTQDERRELILETVGMSSRETEKLLAEKSPGFALTERVKVVTPELTQITFTADEDLIEKLTEIKDLFAHQLPTGANHADVIRWMAGKLIASREHDLKKESARGQKALPLAARASRYIPAPVRREVWRRDQGRCTYTSSLTGKTCGSKYRLEIDHIIPHAKSGPSDDPSNLRLLCRSHNALASEKIFGRSC